MSIDPAITKHGDTLCVELMYPRSNDIKKIKIGLCDVRSADDILVEYDFNRDGWSVKQASTFSFDANDSICDPDWQEVAFIQAWGREKPEGREEK